MFQQAFWRSDRLDATNMTIPARRLPLHGGQNFRDLGGYATHDGRCVRWRMVYRSGSMAALTDQDCEYLGTLGIRTICDFRDSRERRREPTRWHPADTPRRIETDYELDLGAEFMESDIQADRARALFTGFYRKAPRRFAPQYRRLFASLLEGEVPLVFNCAGGKDRTGLAAALLLSALGVPREAVFADYMLSNEMLAVHGRHDPRDSYYLWLNRLAPAARSILTRVERGYLEAALDEIERGFGGVEQFLEGELGIDAEARAQLRQTLTEAVPQAARA